jgi:hypothetical protein
MNRVLLTGVAIFLAFVGIALVGGDNQAVAGHGCHGCGGCYGVVTCDGCSGFVACRGVVACHGAPICGGCYAPCSGVVVAPRRAMLHQRWHGCHGCSAPVGCFGVCSGACGGVIMGPIQKGEAVQKVEAVQKAAAVQKGEVIQKSASLEYAPLTYRQVSFRR